ncbi:hypothetical protein DPMN_098739 [Dreissena polymorpha]|uniref:Uncharacterized protein n=1 Tax=Dreissena polymorpha TaxID=45954 RepID=A0A9D4LEA7_DREPO|nr:hypothetical protein DPMN_098739 [Dreissena polymorpha]
MSPLAVVQEQELMPALVPAPFPPHSFYAIWTFVPSPGPDQLPLASAALLYVCFAMACSTCLRTLRPLPDIVSQSKLFRKNNEIRGARAYIPY